MLTLVSLRLLLLRRVTMGNVERHKKQEPPLMRYMDLSNRRSISRSASICPFIGGTAPNGALHEFPELVTRPNLQPARCRGKYSTFSLAVAHVFNVYTLPDPFPRSTATALGALFDGCSHRRRNIYTTPSADCHADVSALFSVFADMIPGNCRCLFFFLLWLSSFLQREVSPLIFKAGWKIWLSFYSQM